MPLDHDEKTSTDPTDRYFYTEKTMRFKMHHLTMAFVVLLIAGSVAIYLFQSWYYMGTQAQDHHVLKVIHADPSPLKMKPSDPGGYVPPDMDKSIYNQLASKDSLPKVERIAPPPENVIERPKSKEEKKIDIIKQHDTMEGLIDDLEKKDKTPSKPDVKIAAHEAPTIKTKQIEPMPAKKKEQMANIQSKITIKKKGFTIQLASFKNEKDAHAAWNGFQKKHQDSLAKLAHSVSRKDLGNKGIFYRLYAGEFKSETEARRICKKLQDKQQSCFVVSLEKE